MIGVFPACAFKPSEKDVAEQALQKMDGRIITATLKWEGQETPVIRNGSSFKVKAKSAWLSPEMLIIPAKVPDSIELELNIAKDTASLKDLKVEATATLADNLIGRKVSIESIDSAPSEIGTTVRLKIGELHSLFRDDKEERVSMQLTLNLTNNEKIGLELNLCTPPNQVSIEKLEVTGMSPALQELTTPAKTLKLLQAFHLQNNSFERVKVGIPFHNRAKINIPGKRYSIEVKVADGNPHGQASTQKVEDENQEFDGEFYLFPMKDDLTSSWTGVSQKDMDSIFLAPKEKITFGLYVDEAALAWVNTHPASKPSTQDSPVGGYATCPQERIVRLPQGTFAQMFQISTCTLQLDSNSKGKSELDNSELCDHAIKTIDRCFGSNFTDHDICTEAALNDDELYLRRFKGGSQIPWYSCRNNCGERSCTKPQWDWVPIQSQFQVGLQTGTVTAQWEAQSVLAVLRFAPEGDPEVTESRVMRLAPENMWLRD